MKVDVVKIEKLVAYVESETTEGMYYKVTIGNGIWTCTCPDHIHRQRYCKHMKVVQFDEGR